MAGTAAAGSALLQEASLGVPGWMRRCSTGAAQVAAAQTVHHRPLVLQIGPGRGAAISARHGSGQDGRHGQSRAETAGRTGTSAMETRAELGGLGRGRRRRFWGRGEERRLCDDR